MLYIYNASKKHNYTDLRPLQDDKTVLTNPDKGWYLHYVDNGMFREAYRTDIENGDYLLNVDGMRVLYLRLDWADIEKEDGVFSWDWLDGIMRDWGGRGYTFSFRFCTYEAAKSDYTATPKWVFEKGAQYRSAEKSLEPDYADPVFLKYLGRFLCECGKKLNGSRLVQSVDIGTFGTWGEGHTWAGSNTVYPFKVLKEHIDMHIRCFPDTRLIINDDMLTHRHSTDKEDCVKLLEYCVSMGMGVRDDSINVKTYIVGMGFDTLRTPEIFDEFSDNAPVDIEFEHFDSEQFAGGYRHIEALKRTRATFAGFHTYISKWYPENRAFHDYIANRLGYWYFPEGYSLADEVQSGTYAYMDIDISNRGYARAYTRYDFMVALRTGENAVTVIGGGDADNTQWLGGKTSRQRVRLDFKGVNPGKYELCIGMFKAEQPVLLGLKDSCRRNDFYTIGEITVC